MTRPDWTPPSPNYTPPADVVAAFTAIGWRIDQIRPSIETGVVRWSVTVRRGTAASMWLTGSDPGAVLAELLRYATADGAP